MRYQSVYECNNLYKQTSIWLDFVWGLIEYFLLFPIFPIFFFKKLGKLADLLSPKIVAPIKARNYGCLWYQQFSEFMV